MQITRTQDPKSFRVTLPSGESKVFYWPELRWWIEDNEQREFSDTVEIPEFEVVE